MASSHGVSAMGVTTSVCSPLALRKRVCRNPSPGWASSPRSGTAIGANVEEAIGGQSRADFLSKISIAYKEARETRYWLRLLKDANYLVPRDFESIFADADELCRILSKIITTTKDTTL